MNHVPVNELPYCEPVQKWLTDRYGKEAVARYHFIQCPNAEFARRHDLLHVLPLMCNSDFFGIGELHGQLIRCGTCGNSDKCDYLIVGSKHKLAAEYETVTDERGFLVSRRKRNQAAACAEVENDKLK